MWLPVTTRLSGSKEWKNSRVSHCAQRLWPREFQKHLDSRNVPWILAAIRVFRKKTGLPVLARDPHFCWVLNLWLGLELDFPILAHLPLIRCWNRYWTWPRSERSSPHCVESKHHFLMRHGFWPLALSMNIRDPRRAFRARTLLAYLRWFLQSRIYPILWREMSPLHASALLHWLLGLS